MRRKLIKQGANSCTITMPSKWLEKNNLNGGDEVDIDIKENIVEIKLIDNKYREIKSTQITFESNYTKRVIRNVLNQLYRLSYDEIKLVNMDEKKKEVVEYIIGKTQLGFEIVEETENSLIISSITEPSNEKFDLIFKKLQFLMNNEIKEVKASIETNDFSNMNKREDRSRMIDSYTNFCRRILYKDEKKETNLQKLLIVGRISLINHANFRIFKYVKENKVNVNKKILELYHDISKYCEFFFETLYKNSIKRSSEMFDIGEENNKKLFELIKNVKGENAIILHYISEIHRQIHIQSSDLLAINFLD
jgi:antitoxin component of MazEF toxin-antitoxin module